MNRKVLLGTGLLLLALALPGLALAQAEKSFSRKVDLRSGGRLSLETFKGSIELEPWDREQVEIEAKIIADSESGDAYGERSVEATRVEVTGSGSSVRIKSSYQDVPCEEAFSLLGSLFGGCSKRLPLIHYTIRAPRELQIRIEDHKSTIELTGFRGRFSIQTHKGIVDATELSGEFILETHKGRARVLGLEGGFSVETHRGEIEIQALEITSRSRIDTHRGTVTITLGQSQGLSIRADLGRRAGFHSDFPLTMTATRGGRLEGDINGGGPVLRIATYRGEIHIRQN